MDESILLAGMFNTNFLVLWKNIQIKFLEFSMKGGKSVEINRT